MSSKLFLQLCRFNFWSKDFHFIFYSGRNFATSEEYETRNAPGHPVAPQRSYGTESSASSSEFTDLIKPGTEAQNALHSISETRSEVERNTCEIDNTRSSSDAADEPQDLSQIPQLIHDHLIVLKEQQQGKKLRPDLLRSMVANKVNDLSDNRYSLKTILGCYDRLNSEDAVISALISSICGGEPLRGAR